MRIRDSLHDDRLPLNSYYTATCNDLDVFRRLEGNERTEVCVIGGGFTGVCTALELVERGVDVALVEQNLIGWGASGRCGGQIVTGPTNFKRYEQIFGEERALSMWRLGTKGPQIIRERVEKYEIDCDLTWGGIELARSASGDANLQAHLSSLELHGGCEGVQFLPEAEITNRVKGNGIVSGLVRSNWGHCHPLNLVRGEARAAEKLGAKIFEDARVQNITFGETHIVDTGHGKVTADKLVIAGNAYLGSLVPKLASLTRPVGSYAIATEPLEHEQRESIMSDGHILRLQGDVSEYCYFTPDNRLLYGTIQQQSGKHPGNVEKALRAKMTSLFPQLKNVKCDYAWGGFVGVGRNLVPQVGRLDDTVFYSQAYAGRGTADSHVAARMMADAIIGDTEMLTAVEAVEHLPFSSVGAIGSVWSGMKKLIAR